MATKAKAAKREAGKVSAKVETIKGVDDWYGQMEIANAVVSIIGKRMIFRLDGSYPRISRFEKMFAKHGAPKINHLIVNLTPDEIEMFKCMGVDVFDKPNYCAESWIGKMLVGYVDGVMYTHIDGIGAQIGLYERMFDKHGIKIEGVEIEPTADELKKFKRTIG